MWGGRNLQLKHLSQRDPEAAVRNSVYSFPMATMLTCHFKRERELVSVVVAAGMAVELFGHTLGQRGDVASGTSGGQSTCCCWLLKVVPGVSPICGHTSGTLPALLVWYL